MQTILFIFKTFKLKWKMLWNVSQTFKQYCTSKNAAIINIGSTVILITAVMTFGTTERCAMLLHNSSINKKFIPRNISDTMWINILLISARSVEILLLMCTEGSWRLPLSVFHWPVMQHEQPVSWRKTPEHLHHPCLLIVLWWWRNS